ncbi:hypothetical protein [Nonomuraea endophytica]|uniref:DUF5709 domain-containing protein n=2 Tax=Nonomuraea endophytica TaxID=714136 RepID=A0A7W8EIX7_9ACTN|nr:hypothetical protein [Nonomuraea endophytica]MBB5081023.1 hypothetical protein [Nonomuraea endophytica]
MSEMDVRGDDLPFDEDDELSPEAPEADAAEQRRRLRDEAGGERREYPIDVDPGDAAEQDRVVTYDDDDDYR